MSDGTNLCPVGDWDATVRSTEAEPHQTADYMIIVVGLEVEAEGKTYNMFGRINLSDAAAGINRKFFRAIGFDPDENPMILHEQPLMLNGNKTRVSVEHKVNKNGETYARVSGFIPPRLKLDDKIKAKFDKAAAALKAAKKDNSSV